MENFSREAYLTVINLGLKKGDQLKVTINNFGQLKMIIGNFSKFVKGSIVLKTVKGYEKVRVTKIDDIQILRRTFSFKVVK